MKPSERIQEMYKALRDRGDLSDEAMVNAIVNYLDEQYSEKIDTYDAEAHADMYPGY